ncbi:carbon monoxide dehydrogenase [Chromatiales bacterium (ex Bugula neritina AB1)]|nr:carbon monoxide dehydrogenase [Chromatiales bacterium (ex Bugula neritina AB1)]
MTKSFLRLEDPPLLRGGGCYTDDLQHPDQLYMAVLRSPVAHAVITRLDTGHLSSMPGVVSVLTANDDDIKSIKPMNCRASMKASDGSPMLEPDRPILAGERIMHIGEPVVAVVAESLLAAQDAIEAVELDFESLPAITDVQDAFSSKTRLWPEIPNNRAFHWEKGNREETEQQFAVADHIFELTIQHPRVAIAPIEPRSCLAEYCTRTETLTLHSPSQGVISLQRALAGFLGIDNSQLRVITRDVGGSFAVKIWPYAEQLLALTAARRTGRAIKWTATRSESFLSDVMGRGRVDHAGIALDSNGRILAFRIRAEADMGAYLNAVAPFVATTGAVRPFGQSYDIPALHYEVDALYTNTMTTDAYRGAGKPESSSTLERLIDYAADQLQIDRLDIRKRNLVRPEQLPYQTPMSETYDGGNFPHLAELIRVKADWDSLPDRKRESQRKGMLRGAGVGFYLHATGGSTDERSEVHALADGSILVRTGQQDNGQGHKTALAIVTSEALGLPVESIRVEQGDTDWLKHGGGTGGSNLIAVAATTVHRAANLMIENAKETAGEILEAAAIDIAYASGEFRIVGTDRTITLSEVASKSPAIGINKHLVSTDTTSEDTGCSGIAEFEGTHTTFPNGVCVCEVEVDPLTGVVHIDRYSSIDDIGRVFNEATTIGQLQGGVAQAAGEVLMEAVKYDETGQLLSGSLMDYHLPRAGDLPVFDISFAPTDSPNSILSAKGVGELSSIGAPGPIHNAVMDALNPLGITHIDTPLTPLKVWNAINTAN